MHVHAINFLACVTSPVTGGLENTASSPVPTGPAQLMSTVKKNNGPPNGTNFGANLYGKKLKLSL